MADVLLEPLKVFCSYSHNDEPLKDELAKHLTMLERQGYYFNLARSQNTTWKRMGSAD
ncbi:hypothetical protein ACEYW6_23830 [Nostoc sp. UIC 10607]|uniref:hypothetical protein n=1 Tax=Nostoc sp. UIC 10607 TaxID=3045935 RepID=UPI0039A10CCA